jgi:REP element-mobilizing transposase RayT
MSSGIFNKYTGYHNRKSIRLPGHDYSLPGAYFVTICIHDWKQKLLGGVVDGAMVENDYGNTVRQCWNDLPAHYPQIRLDEFIIMPNHVHGIIVIHDFVSVGARSSRPSRLSRPNSVSDGPDGQGRDDRAPTNATDANATPTGKPTVKTPTLGNIVAYFKYQTTKQINAIRQNGIEKIWQRNYYDHIIRDAKSHYWISQYIRNNPANWTTDSEHHLKNEIEMFDRMETGRCPD